MSATELIAEKSRTVTTPESEAVLANIEGTTRRPAPTATELRKLPPEVRARILAAQMALAERVYREHPELIWDDAEPPMDYPEANQR